MTERATEPEPEFAVVHAREGGAAWWEVRRRGAARPLATYSLKRDAESCARACRRAAGATTRRELRDLLTAAYETAYALPVDEHSTLLLDLLESCFDALGVAPERDTDLPADVYALDPCREPATGRRRLAEEPDVCPDGDEVPF